MQLFIYYALVYINYWNFLKAIHSTNASFPIFMSTIDFACQITNILYSLLNLGSFQLQNSKKFSIKDFKRVLFMLLLWIYLFLSFNMNELHSLYFQFLYCDLIVLLSFHYHFNSEWMSKLQINRRKNAFLSQMQMFTAYMNMNNWICFLINFSNITW